MHPGAWLLWALSASFIAISTTNPFYLLPLFAICLLLHAVRGRAEVPNNAFRVFITFGLIALCTRTLLVLFGSVSRETIAAAALEGLRLAVLLTVYGTLNSVTDPYGFLRLAPRRFHEPALAAALALSLAPRTVDAVGRVREAQRLRGITISRWRALPALAVPVLETGMEEAVTLAESMDARGHGRGPRSRYRPQRWRSSATLSTVAALLALGIFTRAMMSGVSDLSVSTFPLTWPGASLLLVGTLLFLAVPAMVKEDERL